MQVIKFMQQQFAIVQDRAGDGWTCPKCTLFHNPMCDLFNDEMKLTRNPMCWETDYHLVKADTEFLNLDKE